MASLNFIDCEPFERVIATGETIREAPVRVIAKQFGVDPGTVQRISRPFAAASVAVG